MLLKVESFSGLRYNYHVTSRKWFEIQKSPCSSTTELLLCQPCVDTGRHLQACSEDLSRLCGSSSAIDHIHRALMWQGPRYTGWLDRDLGLSGISWRWTTRKVESLLSGSRVWHKNSWPQSVLFLSPCVTSQQTVYQDGSHGGRRVPEYTRQSFQ